MKIIIISRSILPKLTPRAFRATELAKEFARQGHEVVLYAVLGKFDYRPFEEATGIKVKKIPNIRFATLNSDGNIRYNLFDKLSYHALKKVIEFPDIELSFRTYSIIKYEKNIDLLITIAVPHTIHWGAALAKTFIKRDLFPKVWISDCGDPYCGESVYRKKWFYFKYIEKWWADKTDYITVPVIEAKSAYLKNAQSKIRIIPQGFNFENQEIDTNFKKNRITTFAYAGSILYGYREPNKFMSYLTSLKQDFKFIVYTGNVEFFEKYKSHLGDKLEINRYIEREKLIYQLSQMDFLVNFKNKVTVQTPSKLIDYYITRRPILEINNEFDNQDVFQDFLTENYSRKMTEMDVSNFDIKNVVNQFLKLTKF